MPADTDSVVALAFKWIVEHWKAPSGVVVRATVATMLSAADLASDVYTIVTLHGLGRLVPAYALLAMMGTSFSMQVRPFPAPKADPSCSRWAWPTSPRPRGLMRGWLPQLAFGIFMTKHRGTLAVLWDVILTVTCLKPGVEVWRIGRGEARDPGAPLDPKSVMLAGKLIERVFESIPGAVLTAVTLLDHVDARSPWSLASIVLACLATAFVATTIAYNYDTDAEGRLTHPAFYG